MYTGLSDELIISGLDNVSEGTDHQYSITKYDYDHLGNLKKVIDPLGQEETYNYDKNNRMYEKKDKNGQLHEYDYDGLGRQLEHIVTTDSGMNTTSQEYTLTGALLNVTSDEGGQSFIYDDLGRVEEETDLDGTIKAYTYDSGNNRKTLDIQKGSQVITNMEYDYDEMNRLEYVYDNTVLQATYVYDANGNRDSLTLANGISTEYEYTIGNLLETLTNKNGETVLSTYTYTYYLDGNQESKTDQDNKVTMYVYDDLGRLTSESISGENTINYTYDDANNRESKIIDNESVTDYAYDLNNQLKEETFTSGDGTTVTSFSYDNNGNQYSKITETIALSQVDDVPSINIGTMDNTSVEFNSYNGFNQLIQVEKDDIIATYTYKVNGIRDSKTVNGVTIHFVLDGGRVVAELDNNDNVNATYEYGINLLSVDNADGFNYYIFNGHGDVTGLVNAQGTITKNYDYDAFGIEKNPDESDINPFRYSGEYFDKETGTYYLRTRYYNPTIGRFITVDTYLGVGNDPLSLNLYTYCSNNPVRFYDPSGHDKEETIEQLVDAVYYLCTEYEQAASKVPFVNVGNELGKVVYESIWKDGYYYSNNNSGVKTHLYNMGKAGFGSTAAGTGMYYYMLPGGISLRTSVEVSLKIFGDNIMEGIDKFFAKTSYKTSSPYDLNATHKINARGQHYKDVVVDVSENGIQETIKYVEYNGQQYVVDGHHRLRAAKELGLESIPVEQVELPYLGYKTIEDILWVD